MEKIGIIGVRWDILWRWFLGWFGWLFAICLLCQFRQPIPIIIATGILGLVAFLWPWVETIKKEKKSEAAVGLGFSKVKSPKPISSGGEKPRGPKPKPSEGNKPSEQKPEDF